MHPHAWFVVALLRIVRESENPARRVFFEAAPAIDMSLLQVGLNPAFYQFAEASIEVTMDIKTTTSSETDGGAVSIQDINSGGNVGNAISVGDTTWLAGLMFEF